MSFNQLFCCLIYLILHCIIYFLFDFVSYFILYQKMYNNNIFFSNFILIYLILLLHNLTRSYLLSGMRPLLFSSRSKKGWVRAGKNIKYYYSSTNNNNTNSTNNTNFQSGGIAVPSSSTAPTQSQNGRRESKDHTHAHRDHTHTHTCTYPRAVRRSPP